MRRNLRRWQLKVLFALLYGRRSRPWILRALVAKERFDSGLVFDATDPAVIRNPYPTYQSLQRRDPVHWSELAHGWLVTGHDEVQTLLQDSRLTADRSQLQDFDIAMEALGGLGPAADVLLESVLGKDPPDHGRLRTLVSKAFTPQSIGRMQHRIEATVGDLLEQAESRLERTGEPLDLMRDLAVPLPLIVIAEMLGIPPEDRASLKQWSDALARITDPVVPPSLIRDADRAVEAFTTYLEPLIAERRASPRDDLLSALVNAEQAGEQMTERELHGMCALLVAAGNETTTNLIGNGFAALFANPDQLQILRKDPGRAGEVIEEVMRYDSPVQFTTRVVAEPITVRGRRLTPGQFVMLGLAAANRDEAVFAEPDRFLVDRFRDGSNGARHLALGHGAHYCLGAALARMEGTTAFRQAIERWPQLGPAGSVTWRETFTLRGPESLPALPSGAEGSAPIPRALTPAAFG